MAGKYDIGCPYCTPSTACPKPGCQRAENERQARQAREDFDRKLREEEKRVEEERRRKKEEEERERERRREEERR